MPRAGWCRECGAWIWVDTADGCPSGHSPECVSDRYEAQPVEPASVHDAVGDGEPPRFLGRQARWLVWGALGSVAATALTIPAAMSSWRPYGLAGAAVAEPVVWLAAEIALGLWLAGRMRLEHPAAPSAADKVA